MKAVTWLLGAILAILVVISVLLLLILRNAEWINANIPDPCGDRYVPCHVEIAD